MAWVPKPWVAAYFFVGQRNDNGSHGSPTDLQYIFYIWNENIFDGVFFIEKKNFF